MYDDKTRQVLLLYLVIITKYTMKKTAAKVRVIVKRILNIYGY